MLILYNRISMFFFYSITTSLFYKRHLQSKTETDTFIYNTNRLRKVVIIEEQDVTSENISHCGGKTI